jgi:hypothetical protein
MFRKTLLAIATTAAVGAAALIPTAASAKHFGHGHHGHFRGFGGFGVTIVDTTDASCWQWVKVGRNLYKQVYVCD